MFGGGCVCGDGRAVVDKVRLRSSIMSCSDLLVVVVVAAAVSNKARSLHFVLSSVSALFSLLLPRSNVSSSSSSSSSLCSAFNRA